MKDNLKIVGFIILIIVLVLSPFILLEWQIHKTNKTVDQVKTALVPLNTLATEIILAGEGAPIASTTDFTKSVYGASLQIQQALTQK